jgi:nicotinamide mononucleotide transporter
LQDEFSIDRLIREGLIKLDEVCDRFLRWRNVTTVQAFKIANSLFSRCLQEFSHILFLILFPTLFPEKASFPYLDTLTTIASFTAMWLLVQKRIESWYYWIVVDVIGIGLYYVKGVRFIALLYVILLGMAING